MPTSVEIIAAHEAGHVILGHHNPYVAEVHGAAIWPPGHGETLFLPIKGLIEAKKDLPVYHWYSLLVHVGGMAGELAQFGAWDPDGAVSDWWKASRRIDRLLELKPESLPWVPRVDRPNWPKLNHDKYLQAAVKYARKAIEQNLDLFNVLQQMLLTRKVLLQKHLKPPLTLYRKKKNWGRK